jgi:drug/metabolite transporter (DMT)-like permease
MLYLGSGLGLCVWLVLKRLSGSVTSEASLKAKDLPWLAGAISAGGVVAPILLLFGLSLTAASTASLLLNLEGVLTAVIAWFVFRENFDRRIAFGMLSITIGGVILSWAGTPQGGSPWGAILIAGACLMWAVDNNLTRRISAVNPIQIAALKGLFAGSANLLIALVIGASLPSVFTVSEAAVVGLLGYGISLTLFVLALRHIGTARTGAYFSVAPFIGAVASILFLGEPVTISLLVAAAFMALGVYLHLTERHQHEHDHVPLEHEHSHTHDEHHKHEHSPGIALDEPHSHSHKHEEMTHSHDHFPDIHHRH